MVASQATGGVDSQGLEFVEKSSLESRGERGGARKGEDGRMPRECSPWSSRLPSRDLAFAD